MKPEQWIIEDMRAIRKKQEKNWEESQYLELLVWYVSIINSKDKL